MRRVRPRARVPPPSGGAVGVWCCFRHFFARIRARLAQFVSHCIYGTRLGKQGRRIAGRSDGSPKTETKFGTQNSGTTHARRTTEGSSTIPHPHRERSRLSHSSQPPEVPRSRSRPPRQENRRAKLGPSPRDEIKRDFAGNFELSQRVA